MSDQIDEAAQTLRMDLDVVAVRAAADSPARMSQRFLEELVEVFAEPVDSVRRERTALGDDAFGAEAPGHRLELPALNDIPSVHCHRRLPDDYALPLLSR
jgi:hypothetical protein